MATKRIHFTVFGNIYFYLVSLRRLSSLNVLSVDSGFKFCQFANIPRFIDRNIICRNTYHYLCYVENDEVDY